MRPLDFHPEARRELLQAQKWYDHQSLGLGLEFLNEVRKAVDAISAWPQTWPSDARHFHRFLLHRFPFAVSGSPKFKDGLRRMEHAYFDVGFLDRLSKRSENFGLLLFRKDGDDF